MSKKPTQFQDWEIQNDLRVVDNKTCQPLTTNQTYLDYLEFNGEHAGKSTYNPKHKDQERWTRLQFWLFSMFVATGFFASYTVAAFYTIFLYGISPTIRAFCFVPTWYAFCLELTDATHLMRLFEAVYMYRHEQDLYNEEETYRMVQEIIRSPGLFKLITGSSLKGSADPTLDNMQKDVRDKLKRLEILQQKGFDITPIREKILKEHEE